MIECDEILERLEDLYLQATHERSHFYSGKCIRDSITKILELRDELHRYSDVSKLVDQLTDAALIIKDDRDILKRQLERARILLERAQGYCWHSTSDNPGDAIAAFLKLS